MTGPELTAYSTLGRLVGEAVADLNRDTGDDAGDALQESWDAYAAAVAARPARDDVDRASLTVLTAWHGVRAWLEASDLLDYEPVRRMDAAEQAASRLLGLVPLTPEKA